MDNDDSSDDSRIERHGMADVPSDASIGFTEDDDSEQFISEEVVEAAKQGPPRGALDVLADSTDLYERKNADYGDSWQLVGKTMALWLDHQGVDELTIPTDAHTLNSFGLFTRRLDKMLREFNGWFVADEMQVSEAIAETHQDDVPYAAMHTQLAEEYARMDYHTFGGQ